LDSMKEQARSVVTREIILFLEMDNKEMGRCGTRERVRSVIQLYNPSLSYQEMEPGALMKNSGGS
jgi:hypothetical protein